MKEKMMAKLRSLLTLILIAGLAAAVYFAATELVIPARDYRQAEALLDDGRYAEATAAFAALGDFRDAAQRVDEGTFLQAKALLDDGETVAAYELLTTIRHHAAAAELLHGDPALMELAFTVGTTVRFGSYPVPGGEPVPLDWTVLECDGTKALLLSRYGLDCRVFTDTDSAVWETSTVREWLNGEFLERTFTEAERGAILLTDVDNGDAQGYSEYYAYGGGVTQDYAFLLSCAEAEQYFGADPRNKKNPAPRVAPLPQEGIGSPYLSENNLTEDGKPAGWWWLRSPGVFENCAAVIFSDGSLGYESVNANYICVRPALWVNLESGIF